MRSLEFQLSADFGMFRKPYRQIPALTFNFIPKSAVLGACGALIGLGGYGQNRVPEFIAQLQHLKIAVAPYSGVEKICSPFTKTTVTFVNYHGYGNVDGNGIYKEQILIKPSYRINLIGEDRDPSLKTIEEHGLSGTCVFRPYMGKNEFIADIQYLGQGDAHLCEDENVACDSIYPISMGYRPARGRKTAPSTFSIMDDYAYSFYGENMLHKIRTFAYQDGEIVREQAGQGIGAFYQLPNTGRIVFAF